MRYVLAMAPLLVVLVLMLRLRWGAHKAGLAGWLAGVVFASLGFGLTPQVFWVSQAKGLLLSVFVLAVMWPALFLYHWNAQKGSIGAFASLLQKAIPEKGMCLLLLAWALSGLLEGLAGFGLPIAVVAPMLTSLGVTPVRAVTAVAVGHSWAVTFGDMGVIMQTLVAVVGLEASAIVPWAALLLGLTCLVCGLLTAAVLSELKYWKQVSLLATLMGLTQYLVAAAGLVPLSGFAAGASGLVFYVGFTRVASRLGFLWTQPTVPRQSADAPDRSPGLCPETLRPNGTDGVKVGAVQTSVEPATVLNLVDPGAERHGPANRNPALLALATYGALTCLMAAITMLEPLRVWAQSVAWKAQFPQVTTRTGFSTLPAPGQVFRPCSHPGTLILLVTAAAIGACILGRKDETEVVKRAAAATWRSAGAATVGVLSMVGLSTLMDHCEMSLLLAKGLSNVLGSFYPVVSPCVGILGAFATGSNNNSNVLFGSLQKNAALLLHLNPYLLVGAQTAGGSLGSMLAPVKIILGCSTVGILGREGEVMRKTVPYGLLTGLALGVLVYLLSR